MFWEAEVILATGFVQEGSLEWQGCRAKSSPHQTWLRVQSKEVCMCQVGNGHLLKVCE